MRTEKGASVLFFGFHSILAILEPSGKGFPLPGMPDLYAAIIVGFATIALSRSSVWLTATICQSSYPLKSENGRPFGTLTAYLSCAELASTPASHSVAIPIVNLLFRLIAAPPVSPLRARSEKMYRCGSMDDGIESRRTTFGRICCRVIRVRLSCGSPQRAERRTQLAREDLWLFPRGEVAALLGLIEVDQVGIHPLCPTARRLEDLAGEHRERHGDRKVRRLSSGRERREDGSEVLPIQPRRRG